MTRNGSVVKWLAELYWIEAELPGLDPEARFARRLSGQRRRCRGIILDEQTAEVCCRPEAAIEEALSQRRPSAFMAVVDVVVARARERA